MLLSFAISFSSWFCCLLPPHWRRLFVHRIACLVARNW
ncbi:hypothetical protein SynRS9909_01300 [Synechococcus sp. RS9909]|nr:hypothetical protein SynRS9909_01300 [Synechococcus sp. RS9909]